MRKKVIIIAAPFGYGPAAKALLIAEALSDMAEVTILTSRDAFRFADRHRGADVHCREGAFHAVFATDAELAPFDFFISINNDPAVRYLIAKGLESRTIFVDSILAWRSLNSAVGFRKSILGYLVQDFPGVAASLGACRATTVELTAPMVWAAPRPAEGWPGGRTGVTLHLGGVTSPLVGWEMLRRPIEEIFGRCVALCARHQRSLTVIGSRHLAAMPLGTQSDVRILGDISPQETAALVGGSELLVTTPGIGAIYEALVCGVPIIVLPPMNSTQLLQYGVLIEQGCLGSIDVGASKGLLTAVKAVSWDRQTTHSVEWLNQNLALALANLPGYMERLLDAASGESAREQALLRQAAFYAALSQRSAVDAIRTILLDATPLAAS